LRVFVSCLIQLAKSSSSKTTAGRTGIARRKGNAHQLPSGPDRVVSYFLSFLFLLNITRQILGYTQLKSDGTLARELSEVTMPSSRASSYSLNLSGLSAGTNLSSTFGHSSSSSSIAKELGDAGTSFSNRPVSSFNLRGSGGSSSNSNTQKDVLSSTPPSSRSGTAFNLTGSGGSHSISDRDTVVLAASPTFSKNNNAKTSSPALTHAPIVTAGTATVATHLPPATIATATTATAAVTTRVATATATATVATTAENIESQQSKSPTNSSFNLSGSGGSMQSIGSTQSVASMQSSGISSSGVSVAKEPSEISSPSPAVNGGDSPAGIRAASAVPSLPPLPPALATKRVAR
jgi:hypothetical protein